MAKVVWDRRDDIASAVNTIKYTQAPSHEDFRPPSTIETDFTRLLKHDVPHINWTFELIHNWYYTNVMNPETFGELTERQVRTMYENGTRVIRVKMKRTNDDGEVEEYYMDYSIDNDGTYYRIYDYEPEYIRGQQTSIDWKSKIGNSDMSTNFKTDYSHEVKKGDYVIREDGMLYMLNWNITLHANNQATQSVECNAIVDVMRYFEDETDDKGMLVEAGGLRPVAAGLPISHSEYAGRPDYSGAAGQAGMHPDHLISVYCQWNDCTRKIRLDDQFVIGDFTYKVVNVSLAEVMVDKDNGVLTLNAKRVAGGTVNGDE